MSIARPHHWFRAPAVGRVPLLACLVFHLCSWPPAAQAQNQPAGDGVLARSYSGQFVVTGSSLKSPLLELPAVTTNTILVRLEPTLLSVSAERIKQSLYRLLAVPSETAWQGKIYLVLRTALYTDETVDVISRPTDQSWSYAVELPDVVQQTRYMRGVTGALLLELANRSAGADAHSAEIPAWLIDGLAQHISQDELARAVISSPQQSFSDPPSPGAIPLQRNLDTLAAARRVLRENPALTFDQLAWPTEAQLAGNDGGVYHASAQLFVTELLKLPQGPEHMQRTLANLPACYNWQTAFLNAWHEQFHSPLELEKWWALAVVNFLAHDPGPAWTPAYSAGRLDDLLTVPVEIRASSNALPSHADIPLQAVVHDLPLAQQISIFQTHLRDLRIAELRMSPQFAGLTDGYCRVLAGFLGERLGPAPRSSSARHPVTAPARLSARELIKRLDELDHRRRTVEAAIPAASTGIAASSKE
jgi:hypothetical protein